MARVNPIYGQGMSVAAMEALLVHRSLATDGADETATPFWNGVRYRYFGGASRGASANLTAESGTTLIDLEIQ